MPAGLIITHQVANQDISYGLQNTGSALWRVVLAYFVQLGLKVTF